MEPVSIRISNDISNLPVILACARACGELAGFESIAGNDVELVLEEIFTNILKYEYIEGYKETVEIAWERDVLGLRTAVRFQGIPFDLDRLGKCEEVSLEDIVEGEAHGLGWRLIKHLAEEIVYRNMGKAGQEISWRHYLPEPLSIPEEKSSPAKIDEPAIQAVTYKIRRMRSDEAAAVSKLAFLAYNNSYIYEHIYFPERVRELNQAGELFSFVAADQTNDEVIGHGAMVPCKLSGLGEMAMAFVDPRCRGGGCLVKLTDALIDLARERKLGGVFVMSVTSHSHSQKAALRYGLRESALLVSRIPALTLRGLVDENSKRESLLQAVRLFDPKPDGPVYVPPRHRKIIEKIYENLGKAGTRVLVSADAATSEQSLPTEIEVETDNYQAAHIRVGKYGADAIDRVKKALGSCCRDRIETVYLYLPLKEPATCRLCPEFEKLSFFFCGVYPGRDGADWLMLQYLNNQKYDYDLIQVHSAFAEELRDYVRMADPNEKGEHDDDDFPRYR